MIHFMVTTVMTEQLRGMILMAIWIQLRIRQTRIIDND